MNSMSADYKKKYSHYSARSFRFSFLFVFGILPLVVSSSIVYALDLAEPYGGGAKTFDSMKNKKESGASYSAPSASPNYESPESYQPAVPGFAPAKKPFGAEARKCPAELALFLQLKATQFGSPRFLAAKASLFECQKRIGVF